MKSIIDRLTAREALERSLGAAPALSDMAPEPRSAPPAIDARLVDVERWHVERVCYDVKGNMAEAARRLNVSRAGMYPLLKRLKIPIAPLRAMQEQSTRRQWTTKAAASIDEKGRSLIATGPKALGV